VSRRQVLAALALTVGLAGCGGSTQAPRLATPPADLVGLWRVEGGGIDDGTYLRLDAEDRRAYLFQSCGSPFGQWRAVSGGALAIMLVVGAPDCPTIRGDDEWERNTPTWLRAVVSARTERDSRVLLDVADAEVARLTPAGTAPGTDLPGERVAPDPVPAVQRESLDRAEPPPAPMRRAEAFDREGRWLPVDRPDGVFVEFSRGGSLVLRDGCNSGRGRWTVGPGGALAVVLSLSYVVACDNAAIADWLQTATWVGFDGGALALVDADGHVAGTLFKS
jgi:hypothetical protein